MILRSWLLRGQMIGIATVVACGPSPYNNPVAPTSPTSTGTIVTISISPPTTTLTVGQTATLAAVAAYDDGTTATVTATWASNDATVANVSATGVVTALAVGTATVTATVGLKSGSVTITVNGPGSQTLSSIEVSAGSASLTLGATTTVTAEAVYTDGSRSQVTPTWSSSDTGVASVAADGTVTTVAVGTTVITATFEGVNGSLTVTVSHEFAWLKVEVAYDDTTLIIGETTTVHAEAVNADGSRIDVPATWTSSNAGVASVTVDGTVTALAVGTAVIEGSYGGKTGSVTLTVSSAQSQATIVRAEIRTTPGNQAHPYSAGDLSLSVGEWSLAQLVLIYSDGSWGPRTSEFSSSDPSVVSVVYSGSMRFRIGAEGVGTAVITGTYTWKGANGPSDSITVEVR